MICLTDDESSSSVSSWFDVTLTGRRDEYLVETKNGMSNSRERVTTALDAREGEKTEDHRLANGTSEEEEEEEEEERGNEVDRSVLVRALGW